MTELDRRSSETVHEFERVQQLKVGCSIVEALLGKS